MNRLFIFNSSKIVYFFNFIFTLICIWWKLNVMKCRPDIDFIHLLSLSTKCCIEYCFWKKSIGIFLPDTIIWLFRGGQRKTHIVWLLLLKHSQVVLWLLRMLSVAHTTLLATHDKYILPRPRNKLLKLNETSLEIIGIKFNVHLNDLELVL